MAFNALEEQIRVLQKRQNDLQSAFSGLPLLRGTTAQRDAAYGVPTTDPARVALANQRVTFYNTDLGWEEQYYAVTGLSGLTVRGLVAGTASGWYPTGQGPRCTMQPTAGTRAVTPGMYTGGWNGIVYKDGGSAWYNPTATVIQVLQAGMYDYGFWTIQTSGNGISEHHFRILNTPGTAIVEEVSGISKELSAGAYTKIDFSASSRFVAAGNQLAPFAWSGNYNLHMGASATTVAGQLWARYVGPPLVTT